MKENVYGDNAADIDYATPETDAIEAQYGPGYPAMTELARKLERERDEARWHADADVMNSIDSGSTEPDKKGWRKECEASEYELRYAAKRRLIERHPVHPTWLRVVSVQKPDAAPSQCRAQEPDRG